ncbi:MAG: glycosyltransferase, partial [Parapedobacter sp.]
FIIPSGSESFGLAALEAMACKVPVISSNTGGLPELNVDGVTGYLSDVGDVDAMATNAIHILEDNTRLEQFKEAALERAKDFQLANIMPLYEQYYSELVNEKTHS